MVSTNSKILASLLLLCVLSGCQPFSRSANKGGTAYTIEIQTDEPNRDEIVERAVKIMQARIDAVGLDGEVSRVSDKPDQISVKLYGSNHPERIKKFLFTTNRLELKRVISSASPLQTYPSSESAAQVANQEQEVLPYQEYEIAGGARQFVIVEKKAVITGEDIRDAGAYTATDGADDYQISFSLRPEGARKFGDWTSKHIGNYLAIVLDKKVLSAPVIRGTISDQGVIEGRFTKAAAEDIALSLKSGYLPATMKILEEKPFD